MGPKCEELAVSICRPVYPGDLNRSTQHQLQSIGRGFEGQGLSRALIEPQSNAIEVGLGEAREIGSSREVLSQQAVGVLVAATLPGTARITEVNLHVGGNREAFVADISLPWSHVRERRSCSGNFRMCLASAATIIRRVLPWKLDEHRKAAVAFDERHDVRVACSGKEISFPMARNCAILGLGGSVRG